MDMGVLGAGFGAVRTVFILCFFLDGLLQFVKDIEFFELRV